MAHASGRNGMRLSLFLRRVPAVGLAFLVIVSIAYSRHTLTAAEERVITNWLSRHPGYRRAVARDCSCDEFIRMIRIGQGGEAPVLDYDPYRAGGDFNDDRVDDIAVVLIDTRKERDAFALLIFNGPLGVASEPVFIKTGLDLTHQGLFYGPPASEDLRNRLLLGRFSSDYGFILVPMGRTYRLREM